MSKEQIINSDLSIKSLKKSIGVLGNNSQTKELRLSYDTEVNFMCHLVPDMPTIGVTQEFLKTAETLILSSKISSHCVNNRTRMLMLDVTNSVAEEIDIIRYTEKEMYFSKVSNRRHIQECISNGTLPSNCIVLATIGRTVKLDCMTDVIYNII